MHLQKYIKFKYLKKMATFADFLFFFPEELMSILCLPCHQDYNYSLVISDKTI